MVGDCFISWQWLLPTTSFRSFGFFKLGHASQWILLYIYVCMYVVVHGYIYNVLMVGWRVYSSFLPLTETVYVEHDREKGFLLWNTNIFWELVEANKNSMKPKQQQSGVVYGCHDRRNDEITLIFIKFASVCPSVCLCICHSKKIQGKGWFWVVFFYIRPIVFLLPPYDSDVHSWFP